MGITSETTIDLEQGDPERIITDDDADRAYIVEVVGPNPVRVDHRSRYAADGTTLSAGQSHTVSNLRGKELYAAAFEGNTAIRVRLAAADVQSQPEREVSVVEGDVSISSDIDISDREAREIGKARVEGSSGVLIDPLALRDVEPVTDSTTTADEDISLTLGAYRKAVDLFVDVSGTATLTVEARKDGGTWRELDTVDYPGETNEIEQYETAFSELRASVDQNLTQLEGSSKGI